MTDFMLNIPNFIRSWVIEKNRAASGEGRYFDNKVFFSVNIFIIKQSMLLTFLELLRIVQLIKSTKMRTTESIHKFFRELTMGLQLNFEKTL